MPLKKQAIPNLEKKLPRRHMSGRLKTDLDNNEALEFGTYYPTPLPAMMKSWTQNSTKLEKVRPKFSRHPFTSLYKPRPSC